MLKKTLAIICLFSLLVLSFGACGKDDGSNAALTYPITSEPRSLDPQLAEPGAENIIANCFEGLVISYEEGVYLPGVAEKWDISADGLSYTFHLRKDAKWHKLASFEKSFGKSESDGLPDFVNAHDFVFAFRRALNPQTHAPYAAELFAIKNARELNSGKSDPTSLGVEAINDHTLEITLTHQQKDFLKTLAGPICMPCNQEFFEATQGKYGLSDDYLMCNGPFYLSTWNQGTSLLLRKNKDYWQADSVFPISVTLRLNPDSSQYAQKVVQGSYSAAPIDAKSKAGAESSEVSFLPLENEVRVLALNNSDSALKNENLRIGLLSAIPDEALQDLRIDGKATNLLIPPCCFVDGYEDLPTAAGLSAIVNNPQKAITSFERALDELGKKSISLEFLCPEAFETAIREILQEWQKNFGVALSAKVSPLPQAALDERIAKGDYQIALTQVRAQSNSVGDFLRSFTSGSPTNIIKHKSEIYDMYIESARMAEDFDALKKHYMDAHNLIIQSASLKPLSAQVNYMALAKGISGLHYTSAGEKVFFAKTLKFEK